MELITKYLAVFLLLAITLRLAKCQQDRTCIFEAVKDFNPTAFYFQNDAKQFRYPDAAGKVTLGGDDDAGLRIVCPAGTISVNGRPLKLSSSKVQCVGGSIVKISGSCKYAPLNWIGCTGEPVATVQLRGKKTSDDKNILEIGYKMGLINFLPVVDELAVNSFKGGYTPRWAHFKALPVKADTNSTAKAALKTSPLSAKVSFETVYDAAQQRTQFMTLFNDTTLVDKYMPDDGSQTFVPSMLVSDEDLCYDNQRTSVHVYETTVPVWKSIDSGNWKRVGEVVRQIAAESLTNDVDVWSGSYLPLWLTDDAQNKTTYITLPEGMKPPQFLFKYVHDAASNRGIVLLTVNNPHLTQVDKKNVICEELPNCKSQFPEFSDFTKGYTYCCSLAAFQNKAKKLGLPVFEETVDFLF